MYIIVARCTQQRNSDVYGLKILKDFYSLRDIYSNEKSRNMGIEGTLFYDTKEMVDVVPTYRGEWNERYCQ